MRKMFMIVLCCGLATGVVFGRSPGANPGLAYNYDPASQQTAEAPAPAFLDPTSALLRWNDIALAATGLDHKHPDPGDPRVFGEQLGPGRSARALAIVQLAVYRSYLCAIGEGPLPVPIWYGQSVELAIASAAHDTLVALWPSQKATFDRRLEEDKALVTDARSKVGGLTIGSKSAARTLGQRALDGADLPDPVLGVGYFPSGALGEWVQDPISQVPTALGATWGQVHPIVLSNVVAYRVPAPPALSSQAYAEAYNEVKGLGGDGIVTPTFRSLQQELTGDYWAYDGTPSLCAPPRLYNQLVRVIAGDRGTRDLPLARLLAITNLAMADAGIAAWESKYFYKFWRPITAIRQGDNDGNPLTAGDPTFTPLGAPASNGSGPNFTPPFPAYPSGHAVFGGGVFQVLRLFYGTDNIVFTFTSDELNGITVDNHGHVRPNLPRTFQKLSDAEEENGQSRIYLGIHFSFDKVQGIKQGERIGSAIFSQFDRVGNQ